MKFRTLLLSLLTVFVVAACGGGGGGGGGSVSNAEIDSDNEEELAIAATEGAKSAVDGTEAQGTFGFRQKTSNAVEALSQQLAKSAAERELNAPMEVAGVCDSGSVTVDASSSGDAVLAYNSCSVGGATINGNVRITSSTSGNTTSSTIIYDNVTYTFNGQTETLDLTVVCSTNNTSFETTCTYSSSTLGIDGRTYTISGSTVSGNSSSGYTVSATVTDPDHGRFTIETTSPILFNCTDGRPSSGAIQFSDDSGVVVTVTYNDCNTFTVSYEGTSNIYSW